MRRRHRFAVLYAVLVAAVVGGAWLALFAARGASHRAPRVATHRAARGFTLRAGPLRVRLPLGWSVVRSDGVVALLRTSDGCLDGSVTIVARSGLERPRAAAVRLLGVVLGRDFDPIATQVGRVGLRLGGGADRPAWLAWDASHGSGVAAGSRLALVLHTWAAHGCAASGAASRLAASLTRGGLGGVAPRA